MWCGCCSAGAQADLLTKQVAERLLKSRAMLDDMECALLGVSVSQDVRAGWDTPLAGEQ